MPELELGQMLWSNAEPFDIEMPPEVEGLLAMLGSLHAERSGREDRGDPPLTSNGGGRYEGDRFALRSYCWCDGDYPGHEESCPPNFEHYESGFKATWYKHLGRGSSINKSVTTREWLRIVNDCIAEIDSKTPNELLQEG